MKCALICGVCRPNWLDLIAGPIKLLKWINLICRQPKLIKSNCRQKSTEPFKWIDWPAGKVAGKVHQINESNQIDSMDQLNLPAWLPAKLIELNCRQKLIEFIKSTWNVLWFAVYRILRARPSPGRSTECNQCIIQLGMWVSNGEKWTLWPSAFRSAGLAKSGWTHRPFSPIANPSTFAVRIEMHTLGEIWTTGSLSTPGFSKEVPTGMCTHSQGGMVIF